MPTLLLERAPALRQGLEHEPRRGLGDAGVTGRTDAHGRLTLDDLIVGVWEGLAVRGTVSCPVCAGPMLADAQERPDGAGGVDPLAGACLQCGSRLS
jgi:hypothetical protein